MGWLWGDSSSGSSSSGTGGNDADRSHDTSHLTLLGGDAQGHQQQQEASLDIGHSPPPLFMLDQLKRAGVPLKAQMSPYLQLDPSIFRESQPQIILPEGYESGRGRFEFYMSYIGLAVGGGYLTGFTRGSLGEIGNAQTKQLLLNTRGFTSSKPWMTRVLNAATKHGSGYAQTAGTAMFIYCITELGMKLARTELLGSGDDLLNSFAGATLAGALFRAPHGMKASGLGAAVGLGLMTAWTLADRDSRRALKEMMARR